MFKWNFLYFNFCSFLLSLSLDITKKSLDPSSHQVFITVVEDPSDPSLLHCKQFQLSQPLLKWKVFQSLHNFCDPSLDYLQHVHVSLVLGSSELEHSTAGVTHSTEQRARSISLSLLAALLTHPEGLLALFAQKAPYWLVFSLESTRYFSVKLLPKQVAHSVFCSSPLPFAELSEIPFSHFTSLSRHLWMWAKPSGVSAAPPSIMSSVNLQKVHSVPSSRSLISCSIVVAALSAPGCTINDWTFFSLNTVFYDQEPTVFSLIHYLLIQPVFHCFVKILWRQCQRPY